MLALYLSLLKRHDDKVMFNQIYNEYKAKILSIAFDILKSGDLAEEATQEVFIKIVNNFDMFKAMESNMRNGWVMIVTQNTALNILKKERRSMPVNDEFLFDSVEKKCWQNPPLDLIEYINGLPEKYINVLQLHYFEGYMAKEIADMLGLTTNAVEQQLSRARKMLKEMILADQKGGV